MKDLTKKELVKAVALMTDMPMSDKLDRVGLESGYTVYGIDKDSQNFKKEGLKSLAKWIIENTDAELPEEEEISKVDKYVGGAKKLSCKNCPFQAFRVEKLNKDKGERTLKCLNCGEEHVEVSKIRLDEEVVVKLKDSFEIIDDSFREPGNPFTVVQILIEPEEEIVLKNHFDEFKTYTFEEFRDEFYEDN